MSKVSLKRLDRSLTSREKKLSGRCFDQFLDLHIDSYIPCILLSPLKRCQKLIIFFHANAEDIGQAQQMCQELGDYLESYILLVEYPGYSIYEGSPS